MDGSVLEEFCTLPTAESEVIVVDMDELLPDESTIVVIYEHSDLGTIHDGPLEYACIIRCNVVVHDRLKSTVELCLMGERLLDVNWSVAPGAMT